MGLIHAYDDVLPGEGEQDGECANRGSDRDDDGEEGPRNMSATDPYDLTVIGAGMAGSAAAEKCAQGRVAGRDR